MSSRPDTGTGRRPAYGARAALSELIRALDHHGQQSLSLVLRNLSAIRLSNVLNFGCAGSTGSWVGLPGCCLSALGQSAPTPVVAGRLVEDCQSFVKVEGGVHGVQVQAEAHHGVGDVRVDPDDDSAGAAKAGHPGQVAQGVGRVGVDDVERGDVDDDAFDAVSPALVDQVVLESLQLGVVQGGG